jgi:hypothetical protein
MHIPGVTHAEKYLIHHVDFDADVGHLFVVRVLLTHHDKIR